VGKCVGGKSQSKIDCDLPPTVIIIFRGFDSDVYFEEDKKILILFF